MGFTPIWSLKLLVFQLLTLYFCFGLIGINPASFWRGWKGLIITMIFLSLFVAMGHPMRHELGLPGIVQAILVKNLILLSTVAALLQRLGISGLLSQLGRLGLPRELLMTMMLMTRYAPLLSDQLSRMRRARDSRMVRRTTPGLWLAQTGGLSLLLIRSMERAERLNDAMLSRGWQSGSDSLKLISEDRSNSQA